MFVSRIRRDAKTDFGQRLDGLFNPLEHKEYKKVKIEGKSYWIYDFEANFKTYGELRVIVSKESVYDEPTFFVTNAMNFTGKFILKLYKKRFAIEVFFKDAKQFLNLESFQCRSSKSWELHLLLINVLHWSIQKRKSISKIVRKIRENFEHCLLFINQNQLIARFLEEVRRKCLT